MRVECYGASRPQQGRTTNEDAFLIIRDGIPVAAVCDGAGNAKQAARKVLKLFQLFIREATLGTILVPKAWITWVRQLDSALLVGAESTFLAVGVVGDQVVGASAGDSQAYLLSTSWSGERMAAFPHGVPDPPEGGSHQDPTGDLQ